MFKLRTRDGFGLIEVTAVVVIGTLILVPVAWLLNSRLKAQRRSEFRDAHKQIESYLTDSFAYRMETFIAALGAPGAPECPEAGSAFTAGVSGVGPILPVQSAAGGFGLRRLVASSLPSTPDILHEEGKLRCQNRSDLQNSTSLLGAQSVYFCVEFFSLGDNSVYILKDGPVFAELTFNLSNFEINAPVSCENYHDDPPAPGANLRGLNFSYIIYWRKNIDGAETRYFTERGALKVFND